MDSDKGTTNDGTHITRRPRRARPPTARTAAVITATAALALLAAACSGSPPATGAGGSLSSGSATSSPSAGDSSSSPSAVAYSRCMRSHGVPDYPDPGNGGQLPKGNAQHFGVSDSVFRAAQQACQHLLQASGSFQQQMQGCYQGGDCPPSLVQRIETAQRKFAECMRSHGVPNWPGPSLDSGGRPTFNFASAGITISQLRNPPMKNTVLKCLSLHRAPVVPPNPGGAG